MGWADSSVSVQIPGGAQRFWAEPRGHIEQECGRVEKGSLDGQAAGRAPARRFPDEPPTRCSSEARGRQGTPVI
jgi:hypothetical protein